MLARFLRDLGIEGDKVPARDDERAALYRTPLTGRRVLILLDNAKDAAQVRPLLPGSSSCAVLVTTRNRTPDLASTRFVDLNVLEDTEALALFSRIVGEERAAAEPDATAEVLVACAGLPLAIRICAARLAARRQWRIATLAGRLRNEHRRLDELSIGDLAVRAASRSATTASAAAAASTRPGCSGCSASGRGRGSAWRPRRFWSGRRRRSRRRARDLVDANLLESSAPDWYRFHDLLRVYATERAQAEEPEAARDEAARGSSGGTWTRRRPQRTRCHRTPTGSLANRHGGYPRLDFGSVDDALAWCDDERANFVAATRQAAAAGLHDIAWRLPPTLFPLFSRRSNWADCVTTHRIAAESAQRPVPAG